MVRWKIDLFSLHTFTQLSPLFAHTLSNDGIPVIRRYLIKMKGYLAAGFSNVTYPYHMGEALYGPVVADKVKLKENMFLMFELLWKNGKYSRGGEVYGCSLNFP